MRHQGSMFVAAICAWAFCGCYTTLTSPAQDRTYREIVTDLVDKHPVALPSGALVMTAAYYQERRAEREESLTPRIVPHMLLTIKLEREAKASTLRVRDDGTVSFDLVRNVRASGKTYQELERDLEQALSRYYLQPQVSVERPAEAEASEIGQEIYLFSTAGSGGRYTLTGDTEADTLMKFLVRVNAITQSADWNEVSVVRTRRIEELNQTISYVILCDMESFIYEVDFRQDVPLYGGDWVYVHLKENPIINELVQVFNLFGSQFLADVARADQNIIYIREKF